MIIQGPSNANIAPAPVPVAQPQVFSVFFDMLAHTFIVQYGSSSGSSPTKSITGATPPAIQTALQNHALRQIEQDQGWAANSATVVTP